MTKMDKKKKRRRMNTFDLLLLDYLDQPLVLSKSSLNSELTQISKRKK